MGVTAPTARARRSLASRFDSVTPTRQALLIFAASRVFSSVLLAAMFALATANDWTFASHRINPTFFTFSGSWDSSFYKRIAETGYPTTVPVDGAGNVLPNSWAFLPVFPAIVRALMVTGLPFFTAAVVISLIAGAAATVLLQRLVRTRASAPQARWATVFFCFGPMSFLLQVGYAESLALALTFASLLLLVRRHYLALIPVAAAAALTRPGALAIAVAIGVHLFSRWSGSDRPGWRDRVHIVLAGISVSIAGLAWPVIADSVTGRSGTYLDTEQSWWVGLVGRPGFVPFTPWFIMAGTFLGVVGVVLVVAVVLCFLCWLSRRRMLALGPEIVGFGAAYGVYLFAVFLPQQSIFRLVLPLSPLLADPAFTRTRRRRLVLFWIGVGLQPVAIVTLWFVGFP